MEGFGGKRDREFVHCVGRSIVRRWAKSGRCSERDARSGAACRLIKRIRVVAEDIERPGVAEGGDGEHIRNRARARSVEPVIHNIECVANIIGVEVRVRSLNGGDVRPFVGVEYTVNNVGKRAWPIQS